MRLKTGRDMRKVEAALAEALGGEWRGFAVGVESPNAAVMTRMEENDAGFLRLTGLVVLSPDSGTPISARDLHRINVATIESAENTTRGQDRWAEVEQMPPLARERGEAPEAFSERVAHYYRLFAAIYPNPVAEMAAYYGIKSPTLHAWVREARLRGHDLPKPRGGGRR